MKKIIVTEKPEIFELGLPDVEVMTPTTYISLDLRQLGGQKAQVINLCRSYNYQSEGYYISLLAEARSHKVIPITSTMVDIKIPSLAKDDAQDFDQVIQESLEKTQLKERCEFTIFFGISPEPMYSKISDLLFNLFQLPLQRVIFIKKGKWLLQSLKAVSIRELHSEDLQFLQEALRMFITSKNVVRKNFQRKKYNLAILVNPKEKTPPSDPKALQKFIKVADKVGFNTEIITKSDYARLSQFDALFIRETTHVNHHTFRFSRKAEYEGIAVLDDPRSILKCTNKVYLKELLESNNILIPKSAILHKGQDNKNLTDFRYPFVLKKPDSAFSQGVKKVNSEEELQQCLKDFFQETEIIIAQEFMPTEFDWRVGILGGEVLYVCKYFMARNHWQIIDWKKGSHGRFGKSESVSIASSDPALLKTATDAANLIGYGLYGVDIKELNGKFYVIEINDNPSIDHGVEDQNSKENIYKTIIKHLMDDVLSV